MPTFKRSILLLCTFAFILPHLLGCWGRDSEKLTVLAGSELRDLEPLFGQIQENTGVELEMTYVGTLDGAERLVAGEQVDLAWFSHGKYLNLLQGAGSRVVAQEKIMLSPVVMGVKESNARTWGWVDNANITWQDVLAKADAGELRFAMTNPAASNSGFTALVGVASAIAGTGDALEIGDIDNEALHRFFKGQALTAGSSGWLAETYVSEQAQLDGMINYESILLGLNQGGQLDEKLHLIYPKEGIITADYPLMLINTARREQYDKLIAYLRSPDFQQALMERTLRRPVNSQVQLNNQFPKQLLVELPFPSNADVIDRLLIAYLDEQRIPAHAIFVLDVSGSMDGDRLQSLKESLVGLTGLDTTLTGQFSRFRNREKITMLTFSSSVEQVHHFTIDNTDAQGKSMEEVRGFVEDLRTNGGTAIYTALAEAYRIAAEEQQREPERYYSVVLMSDGEYNEGIDPAAFQSYYRALPADAQRVRTFTILFGDADERTMEEIASLTNGHMFNAKSEALSTIFKQIRGYQ